MNENVTKLIEELARKLGTTSQYLWQVLVKHAKIDATSGLIQSAIVVLFGIVLYKIHRKIMKEDKNGRNGYYRYEECAIIPMTLLTLLFLGSALLMLCQVSNIINGYFDPEYWALEQILSKMK